MPSSPAISIIIPTYNRAHRITRAVESVLAQTWTDWELLIADDGSMDATIEVLAPYLADSRIRLLRLPHSGLPACPRNAAIREARGEWLAFLDSDDAWVPEKLALQMEVVNGNPAIGLVRGNAIIFDGEQITGKRLLVESQIRSGWILKDLLEEGNTVICSTVLTRRAIVLEAGGFNEKPELRLGEDFDLWLRIASLTQTVCLAKDLAVYWLDAPDSVSILDTQGRHQKRLLAVFEHCRAFLLRHHPTRADWHALAERALRAKWDVAFKAYAYAGDWRGAMSLAIPPFATGRLDGLIRAANCLQLMARGYISRRYHLKTRLILAGRKAMLPFEYARFRWTYRKRHGALKPIAGKCNILTLVPRVEVGGATKVILNAVTGVDRSAFAFHLVPDDAKAFGWDGVFGQASDSVISHPDYPPWLMKCFYFRLLRQLDIKMVFLSDSKNGYELLPELRRRFPELRIIDVVHTIDPNHIEESPGIGKDYIRLSPLVDARVCISHYLRRLITSRYEEYGFDGGLEDRLVTIHNGVDMEAHSPSPERRRAFFEKWDLDPAIPIVTWLGRISKEKQPLLFVDVARMFQARHPDIPVQFVMAGDGLLMERTREAAEASGLGGRLMMTGLLEDPLDLLAASRILVMTSRIEGLPFVIIEALAMGVPCVSADVGAIHEALEDGKTGTLIPMGDGCVDRFVEALRALLESEETYARMASEARPRVAAEYTLDIMGQRYTALFDRME